MTALNKYLQNLSILEKSNRQLDLSSIDVLLLNKIAKANDEGRIVFAKDLLLLKEIASQATIHGRLKHLVKTKLITLKPRKDDGRLLIRWSRVRISPDPPVIRRDHSDVVPFLLVMWNVVLTDWTQSEVYWTAMSGDGGR